MKKLPQTNHPVLLRTDFSNDAAWLAVCLAVRAPTQEGFQANLDCWSDPSFDGLTIEQFVELARASSGHCFGFLVDRVTITSPESLIQVVDLSQEPGRTFRVIPSEIWGVENNLSLANLDFHDFASHTDSAGVFRGFPTP